MERLTDRKTAANLKSNAEGLKKAGIEPSRIHLEYIKLAEYENAKEEAERLRIIANHYGFTSQANMLCEEAAEFTVALNKLRRGKQEAYENIKEELADVLVIALQLRWLLGPADVDNIINEKVQRQLKRIENEKG